MNKPISIAIAILVLCFFVFLLYWADTDTMPPVLKMIYDFPGGDKVGHLFGMGTVTFTLVYSFRKLLVRHKTGITIFLVVILFAIFTGEEFSQRLFSCRTFSVFDLFFSWMGLIFGTILAVRKSNGQGKGSQFQRQ